MDGIHRLPLGALTGALSQLLLDRAATLPDGTKMVPEDGIRWKREACLLFLHYDYVARMGFSLGLFEGDKL